MANAKRILRTILLVIGIHMCIPYGYLFLNSGSWALLFALPLVMGMVLSIIGLALIVFSREKSSIAI
jgi:hypothetical protein